MNDCRYALSSTFRGRTLFTKTSIFLAIFFQKNELQMTIVALKMRFRQKIWHGWKALGLSFLKQRRHFCWKLSGFELWPADGGLVNCPLFRTYIYVFWPLMVNNIFVRKKKEYKENVRWDSTKTAISGIFPAFSAFFNNWTRSCFEHC